MGRHIWRALFSGAVTPRGLKYLDLLLYKPRVLMILALGLPVIRDFGTWTTRDSRFWHLDYP